MYLTWKKRLEIQTEYRDFSNWPYVETNVLPSSKRHQYTRNRQIIAKVLDGHSLKSLSLEFNLDASTISYLLKRALGGEKDEMPELTTALIPGALVKSGKRKKPLSQCSNKRGARGSFQYLLRTVPGLSDHLEKMLTNYVEKKAYGQNLTPNIFHKEFLRLLHDANWSETTYPFDRDNLAYESCRKYFHKRVLELSVVTKKPSREIISKTIPLTAYEEIQIDAQTTDLNTSIYIEVNGIFHSLRLSRLSLYLVKDVATDCNLAYQLCFTKDPNQADVLEAIAGIHKLWKPLELKTPGLIYAEGACLPSAINDNFQNITVNMIRMDNALCHLAHSIRDHVCYKLNTALNFGLPGKPKGRGFIEHGIDVIGQHNHRFASTTGSKPNSPIKETKKNSKKPPVITLNALEEILSVLITEHNIKPQDRLGGMSPLQLMKEHLAQRYLNYSYALTSAPISYHLRQKEVNVKLIKSESRRPHINFEGLRYTGDCLTSKEVLEKKAIIEYDDTDIRHLTVISLKGKILGTVHAPRTWQSHPHSIRTRKRMLKITKNLRLLGKDPLAGYFNYLLENKELPKIATELIRVTREFGNVTLGINDKSNDTQNDEGEQETRYLKSGLHLIPPWSPGLEQVPLKDNQNEKY